MSHILQCTGYDLAGIEIVRAGGCTLHTTDGRDILDLEAGVWATVLGHNHPRVACIIHKQLREISHIGYRATHAAQETAADEVLRALGFHDGKCVFLSSGSEAVEFAVQAGRRLMPAPKLLTLAESFLGSYGSSGTKASSEWILFDRAVCHECAPDAECSEACPNLSALPLDEVDAFAFEPGCAGGFVRFPPTKLIDALCRAVKGRGGLLITNETTTGVGRTGAWFGHHHYDLDPHIVALGKGLGNGYPVSAIALRPKMVAALEESGFQYAQSHQNDPLACAVATEVLRVVRDEALVGRSAAQGARVLDGLRERLQEHAAVRETRGRGLMIALEFEPDAVDLGSLHRRLLKAAFPVGYKPATRLLRFLPPLTLEGETADALLETLTDLLGAA